MKESWTEWQALRLFQYLGVMPHLHLGTGLPRVTLEPAGQRQVATQ